MTSYIQYPGEPWGRPRGSGAPRRWPQALAARFAGTATGGFPLRPQNSVTTMPIGRRLGGAPRWLIAYLTLCLAALLFAATILYVMSADAGAVTRLARDGATPHPVHDIPYADLINRAATSHHLNPALVAAVVAAESGFNARARSPRGAYGLMQVMTATWQELA